MKKLKVAVLAGGKSSEREVSLSSGKEVFNNIDREKYEVMLVDVPRELNKIDGCDVAFIALHGEGGEDGKIQGFLDTKGIKYTGCGVLASAIGMNKKIFRSLMEYFGLPMAKLTNQAPCVVKPSNGGSSVGVVIVKKDEDLETAIKEAKKYDNEVIVEEYLEGIEVSCGVLGNENPEALPIVEILPKKEFFDYEAKYTKGMSEEICPARLSSEMTELVGELSVKAFNIIGGRGMARVDFIISKNKPYILEINTIPGFTANSLLPKEAAVAGISFANLIDRLIQLALE